LEGCSYIDKTDGDRRKRQSGAVTVSEETDRIYLDTTADCLINDPGMGRRIRIGKRGSRATVVWNPWIDKSRRMGDMGERDYLNMLCVESANAADNLVTVAAGGMHQLCTSYQLESL
jgi:D-hexose-6-phosphate mutarotase